MCRKFIHSFIPLTLLLVSSLINPVHAQTSQPLMKTPVIIDTDMAVDDWFAILYLLRRPDVEVLAVAVTGTGEAHCKAGIQNALNLLAMGGSPDIPVACGRETPLKGDHSFPSYLRDSVDSLSGLSIPASRVAAYKGTAVDLLTKTIEEAPEGVKLLALGPLTNVAETLQARPHQQAIDDLHHGRRR